MNLFSGRPLAAAAVLAVLSSAAGMISGSVAVFIVMWAFCGAGAAGIGILYFKKKIGRYRALTSAAVAAAAALFVLRSFYFFYVSPLRAAELSGDGREVCGVIRERLSSAAYAVVYDADVYFVDGKACDVRARLECAYSASFNESDLFVISNAEVSPAESVVSGAKSDGIRLYVYNENRSEARTAGRDEGGFSLVKAAKILNRSLSYRIRTGIGGKEGQLCAAMLLRGGQPDSDVVLDFRRSGISHLLAVSGLHMSVLTGVCGKAAKKLGAGKKLSGVITLLFVLAYLFVLGFPVSAVRSAIMLLCVWCGMFFGYDGDGVSSLSVAVIIILSISPGSVCDAGFILSVSATLGIITVMPEYQKHKEKVRRNKRETFPDKKTRKVFSAKTTAEKIIDGTAGSAVTVLAANMLTSLPVALMFGETSAAAIPANLIFPVVAGAVLVLTVMFIIFLPFPYLSGLFAYYARFFASLMIGGAKKISDIRGVSVSLSGDFATAAVILAAAASAVLLCIRLKRKWLVVLPYILSVTAVFSSAFLTKYSDVECLFVSQGNGEAFCAVSGPFCAVCDISAGNNAPVRLAASEASRMGSTEVECLILTHFHVRHEATVARFFDEHKVRSLWIPEAVTGKDASISLGIAEIAESAGVPCMIYSSFEELTLFGCMSLRLSGPVRIERSTHPVLSCEIVCGERRIVWIGRSSWESDTVSKMVQPSDGTSYIVGRHGPVVKTKCSVDLLAADSVHVYSKQDILNLLPEGTGADEITRRGTVKVHSGGIYVKLKKNDE